MTSVDVTPLRKQDVRTLARVHRDAFPDFFLSTLGEPFLTEFYRAFLGDRSAVALVARDPAGVPLGAVVGTTEPAGFFTRLIRRRLLGFAWAGVRALASHPGSAARLMRAIGYRGDQPAGQHGALLSSLCVDPHRQSVGIGTALIRAWEAETARRGVATAFLATDAIGNDGVHAFYVARGWRVAEGYVTREGRAMNRYTKSLDAC